MSIYNRKYSLSLPWTILICTILFLIPFVIISLTKTQKGFFADEGPLYVFAVGLVPGLAVALAQFILSWVEFKQISKFSSMKIKNVFDSRDSEPYYAKVVSGAKRKIDVQGVTASRFVEDFADETSNNEQKKILISALKKDVFVRFLVPDPTLLDAANQRKSVTTAEIVRDLTQRFPGRIELRYFSHSPTVSIVRADDEFIFGPVFKNLPSRNTPTIHTAAHSALAQCYLDEFDLDWATARPLV
jgi:hypothetical protein